MANSNLIDLEARVRELEAEVADREQDLAKYREQLAVANSKLERLVAQLQQEIKVAHALQKVLVPTEFPNIQGFEFSTKFVPSKISSGDYFDIFEHQDKLRFGLIVATSSGPALSALLLSVLLKLTGQMEARKGAEPKGIMSAIVAEILPQMEAEHRADIFYALVDRRRYEVTYCRLGEVVALHFLSATGDLRVLESCGSSIKPGASLKPETKTITLNPMDKLILCTRGVIDAQSLGGEAFGLERLSRVVLEGARKGVHELRNQILHEVQKFGSGQELKKDLTAVVTEVKEKVIKLAKA